MAIHGSRAYVADGAAGLQVVDLSSPTSPEMVGSLGLSAVNSVVVARGQAYVVDDAHFHVVDISHPDAPSVLETVDARFAPERHVRVDRSLAFVGAGACSSGNDSSPACGGGIVFIELARDSQ